ncbi:unnamed protein product [Schistosoma rodhaini]|uniref:Chromo domain-containing protein n=3 Tax=Schistosoma rodhaini TaxID=6188 RepID=A0AA85EJG1_9TREM|nr:unnamed protein product [Schistosoma rodhaini]
MKQSESEEHNIYLVDSIIDRRVRRGRVEYRVRWKGFPPEQDSWEPFTSLREPCLSLIQDFHIRYRKLHRGKRRYSLPLVSRSKLLRCETDEFHDMSVKLEKDSDDDLAADKSSISSTKSQPPPLPFKSSKRNTVRPTSRRSAPSSVALSSTSFFSLQPGTYSGHSSSFPSSESSVSQTPLVCDSDALLNIQTLNRSDHTMHPDNGWVPCEVSGDSTGSLSGPNTIQIENDCKVPTNKVPVVGLSKDNCGDTSQRLQKTPRSFPDQSNRTTPKSTRRKSQPNNGAFQQNDSVSANPPVSQNLLKGDKNVGDFTTSDTQENSLLGQTRKSVTIMLKASPTHEFQSTRSLHRSNSPNSKSFPNTVSKPVSKKRVQPTSVTSKTELGVNASESLPSCEDQSPISDSIMSKVMNIVVHLKNLRRRPVQQLVLALCQKHHSIPESLVLSSLDILVTRGHLHRVESAKGISYRSNPFVVARGDLKKPASLSAKIKAKYNGGINGKRPKCTTSAVPESKRPNSVEPPSHSSSKIARTDPTTNVHQRSSRRSVTNGSIASQKSNTHCSCYSDINGKIYLNQSSVIVDDVQVNTIHIDGDYSMSVKSPPNILQQGTKIFIVPPASPLNETTFESQMDNLPFHRSEQPNQSSCNNLSSTSGSNLDSSSMPQTNSRRSNRQTDVYKFKSIWVKKNVQGGFTEVWLQSPGSFLKNGFTIQVLEELTIVLNRATCDTSRLIMISGTGTVFSSGIDLTIITGDLLRSAFINPSSCDSFRSSSSSAANVSASRNSNHHKIVADNSKSHHSDNANCSFSQPNYDSNLNSSSHRNANRVHSFFCSPNLSNVGRLAAALRSFLLALVSFPKPVVVGVNGPALGLAVAILPLCDIVYISDSATFYMPYTRLGQIPEGASTYTLNSLVGMPLANELLLAGRKLSAREALQRGLASDLLFPKSFKQELLLRCRKLAENSCMSLEITKCMMKMQHRERIEYVINAECKKLLECWQTAEFRCTAMEFILNEMDDFVIYG